MLKYCQLICTTYVVYNYCKPLMCRQYGLAPEARYQRHKKYFSPLCNFCAIEL